MSILKFARLKFIVPFVLVAITAGCGKSPTAPSPNVTFSQTDLRVGGGATAVSGGVLTVNYTGWLHDASKSNQKGLQFETSIGASPFSFTLGSKQVIGGWEEGVPGMKVGGIRRLVIPPSLAYGGVRNGPIPANATLVFEIELVDAQ